MKYNSTLIIRENDSASQILNQIKENSVILEFGCANGRMTRYMKEQLNCDVYIVEYDEKAFGDALKYAKQGVCCDIMGLSWVKEFKDIKFDYIVFTDVLEHLYAPDVVIKETHALLKDEGSVLVSVPNIGNNDILAKLYMGYFDYTKVGLLDDTHIKFFAKETLEKFFGETGYEIVDYNYTVSGMGKTEQFATYNIELVDRRIIHLLKNRVNGNIYQFILKLQKQSYVKDNNIEKRKKTDLLPEIKGKLYFNIGEGFSEDNVLEFVSYGDEYGIYYIEKQIELTGEVGDIRWDPLEGKGCLMKSFICETNGNIEFSDSIEVEAGRIFLNRDPQVIIGGLEDKKSFTIKAEIEVIEEKYFGYIIEIASKYKPYS